MSSRLDIRRNTLDANTDNSNVLPRRGGDLILCACWGAASMGRTLSEDLRLRVIAAVEAGLSGRAAAERFGVGIATAIRWVRAFKATGSTRAQPKGGDQRSHRIEAYRDVILGAIAVKVDVTLMELADMLRREHDLHVALSTIWRFLDRHAMTLGAQRPRGGRNRSQIITP
jgi:transposase